MSPINKAIKKFGIIALITIFINITSLLVDIFMYKFSIFSIVFDSIGVILTLITGITYLCYSQKSANTIAQGKKLFLTISILNIFNNLIVWVISFYVYNLSNVMASKIAIQKIQDVQPSFFSNHNEKEEPIIINVEEYDAQSRSDILVKRLEELKSLKEKLLISDQEYLKLREEAIKEFIH